MASPKTKKFEFADFRKVSCKYWVFNSAELLEIYNRTNGDPCDGCGMRSSDCGYNRLTSGNKYTKTNADLAGELGITKRQASKLRRQRES